MINIMNQSNKRNIIIRESSVQSFDRLKLIIFISLFFSFLSGVLYYFSNVWILKVIMIVPLILLLGYAVIATISRYKDDSIKRNLQEFCERSELLKKDTDTDHKTITAKFKYWKEKNYYFIEYFARASNKISIEDFPKRLVEVLEDNSNKPWILLECSVTRTSLIMKFTHEAEKRMVIDSDYHFKNNEGFVIKISSRVHWDLKKASSAVALGVTGSGKTNFIKYLILKFLELQSKNEVYVIDGKSAFLYSTKSFNIDGHTVSSPEDAIIMLDSITNIMNQRYAKMNENPEDERDITYLDKFPNNGSILLVIDELLALMALVLSDDKLRKPVERLGPQISSKILNLVVRGRQANIFCFLSGQTLSAEILSTAVRSNLGFRLVLGGVSPTQSMEMFNVGLSSLPKPSGEPYSGYYWLDGMEMPMPFLQPYVASGFRFKSELRKLSERAA